MCSSRSSVRSVVAPWKRRLPSTDDMAATEGGRDMVLCRCVGAVVGSDGDRSDAPTVGQSRTGKRRVDTGMCLQSDADVQSLRRPSRGLRRIFRRPQPQPRGQSDPWARPPESDCISWRGWRHTGLAPCCHAQPWSGGRPVKGHHLPFPQRQVTAGPGRCVRVSGLTGRPSVR